MNECEKQGLIISLKNDLDKLEKEKSDLHFKLIDKQARIDEIQKLIAILERL